MAKGPLPGRRITVKLPFGSKATDNVVFIKEPVAKYLDFNDTELPTYKTKNNATNTQKNPGARSETVRFRTGSKSYKSWKIIFAKGGAKVGPRTVNTVTIPVSRYVASNDIVTYFEKVAKTKKIFALISPEGKRYVIGSYE